MMSANPEPSNPALPEALLAQLAALPAFEPSARLDARVALALREPARARHRAPWLALAAAAGLAALAVLIVPGLVSRPVPQDVADGGSDDGAITRVQALEAEVLAARGVDGVSRTDALWAEAELVRIDQTLQAAYDRAAADTEIENLWRAREVALRQVLDAYRAPASIVHI
jgi:hypothetical protein